MLASHGTWPVGTSCLCIRFIVPVPDTPIFSPFIKRPNSFSVEVFHTCLVLGSFIRFLYSLIFPVSVSCTEFTYACPLFVYFSIKAFIPNYHKEGRLGISGKGLVTALAFKTKVGPKKYKKARYAIGNVSMREISNKIKEF